CPMSATATSAIVSTVSMLPPVVCGKNIIPRRMHDVHPAWYGVSEVVVLVEVDLGLTEHDVLRTAVVPGQTDDVRRAVLLGVLERLDELVDRDLGRVLAVL